MQDVIFVSLENWDEGWQSSTVPLFQGREFFMLHFRREPPDITAHVMALCNNS